MSKNKAVFGMMKDQSSLELAVSRLKDANFSNNDISALLPDKPGSQDLAHEKNTKAPEGAVTGVGAGAILGGALGWLVGVGMLAIPGIGPFIAAGPIVAALAGAGIGSAVGGVSGALVGMGLPEFEAKRYESKVQNGGILLSVHTDNDEEVKVAKEILTSCGAEDISSTSEAKASGEKETKDFDHAQAPISNDRTYDNRTLTL